MILAESYSGEWIHSHLSKKGFEKINPPLADKMIHALGLVEALAASGLDFLFKGGTSLILLMTMPGRFFLQNFLRKAVDAGCDWVVLEISSEGARQFRHKFIDFHALSPGWTARLCTAADRLSNAR